MKRLILSAVAASMLAMPVMQASAAPLVVPAAPQSNLAQVDYQKHRPGDRVVIKKKVVKKWDRDHRRPSWKRGEKYRDWKRHQAVRDWHRHGLRRPGPGQEWIRVGNDYVLVSILTGIIAGFAAAR